MLLINQIWKNREYNNLIVRITVGTFYILDKLLIKYLPTIVTVKRAQGCINHHRTWTHEKYLFCRGGRLVGGGYYHNCKNKRRPSQWNPSAFPAEFGIIVHRRQWFLPVYKLICRSSAAGVRRPALPAVAVMVMPLIEKYINTQIIPNRRSVVTHVHPWGYYV